MSEIEELVEILEPGALVDVMETKYQVRVNISREPILSKKFTERKRAEKVKSNCIAALKALKMENATLPD